VDGHKVFSYISGGDFTSIEEVFFFSGRRKTEERKNTSAPVIDICIYPCGKKIAYHT
jgi:hypothetical protein